MYSAPTNPYQASAPVRHSTGAPTIRLVSWSAAAINFLVMAMIIGPLWIWNPVPQSMVIGAVLYLTYSWGSRLFLTHSHRQGIRLVRGGRFEEAIPLFQRSFQFFTRHVWLDRYRAVTMLSPSAMGYREMALCNLGFCYSQLDQGAKAKELYLAVQAEYPLNAIAPIALRMIASGEQISTESKSSQ